MRNMPNRVMDDMQEIKHRIELIKEINNDKRSAAQINRILKILDKYKVGYDEKREMKM